MGLNVIYRSNGINFYNFESSLVVLVLFSSFHALHYFSSVQLLSHVWLCDPMDCSTLGFPVHYQLPEFTQTQVHWVSDAIQPSHPLSSPSNHLILCHPLLLPPSIFPSIRVFSNESVLCIRWPKYWSFSFCISSSMSIQDWFPRMDWLDLPAVQGTLKSLLQHHSSKASILRHSVFFIVQLSLPYMTTGKTIALTRWTFVSKVMSLLFNMLSRLITTFFPRSKRLLISWLQSPSAEILEPQKIKSVTVSPSTCTFLRINFGYQGKYYHLRCFIL